VTPKYFILFLLVSSKYILVYSVCVCVLTECCIANISIHLTSWRHEAVKGSTFTE
jgi:hypothetical protein